MNCTLCDLCRRVRHVKIESEGEAGGILFVGYGPSEEDDQSGKIFSGRAGIRLRLLAKGLGVPVAYANIVSCFPGEERPVIEQVATCWGAYGAKYLRDYDPKVIVTLGGVSSAYLLNRNVRTLPMDRLRGKVWDYYGIPLIASYHPGSSMHRGESSKKFVDAMKVDFAKAAAIVRGEIAQKFQPEYGDLPEGDEWVIDCETTSLRPWQGQLQLIGVSGPDGRVAHIVDCT